MRNYVVVCDALDLAISFDNAEDAINCRDQASKTCLAEHRVLPIVDGEVT